MSREARANKLATSLSLVLDAEKKRLHYRTGRHNNLINLTIEEEAKCKQRPIPATISAVVQASQQH